jgi:2-phospho-L-lactate/phosphoenolpyruvate guanylyltransferase
MGQTTGREDSQIHADPGNGREFADFSMTHRGRPSHRNVWAVVPIKETAFAKQRLATALSSARRQELAVAMFEDVMRALSASHGLAGVAVVTLDQNATQIAARWGAQVWTDGARDGHTGAVMAAARRLATTGATMLTIPGDVPRVSPADIAAILAAHTEPPAFTIVPAWDDLGSNAIMCSPPDLVPLRFGPDSFFPHLATARRQGLEPTIVRRPGIAIDIDEPADLARFMSDRSDTRTWALLDQCRAEWDAAVFVET